MRSLQLRSKGTGKVVEESMNILHALFGTPHSHLGVSSQQAPATGGSPCCGANIIDRQTLVTGSVYRACQNCGEEV